MLKFIAKTAILGSIVLVGMAAGPAGQDDGAEPRRAGGLIPLDSRQVERIVAGWPRVLRVGLNPIGLGRVNAVRAAKGLAPLDSESVVPIGDEVTAALAVPAASVQTLAANAALAADRPVSVDNSQLKYFPPIRSQGTLGACVSFAATYTQLSYMTALQRDLDIRDPVDMTVKYSPKWTYNMVNDGKDEGSTFFDNYTVLEKHGAATWAEFPYDVNFRAWCLSPEAWRNALRVRTKVTQYVQDVSTDLGLELTKELLVDGYVLVFGTYINSWVFKAATDDPSTTADDAAAGRAVCYWMNGEEGGHAMTIVGYNDAVWTDINANGLIDDGERGAFRIANSWGTGWYDGGFTWLAYDALRVPSAVAGGPSAGRTGALQSDLLFVLTARNGYAPLVVGEFTLNHLKRDQLKLSLGTSSTSASTPTTSWMPGAFQNQGGAYAFDGTTTAGTATFVLDFADILVAGAGTQRYYLGINDSATGDPATLSAFKIVDLTADPAVEVPSAVVPLTADGQQAYAYADLLYTGPDYNDPPRLDFPQVSPASGRLGDSFTFQVRYYDRDGDIPAVKNVIIDGAPVPMTLVAGQPPAAGWYSYAAVLAAGSHDYSFQFADGRGESALAPLAGTLSGPEVYSHVLTSLSPSIATVGDQAFVLTVNGSDFASGAVVTWDGADRATTFLSSARVDAQIGAADLSAGGTVPIAVRNPGGGYSNTVPFTVNNPVPSLTSLSPTEATGGATGLSLTLRGAAFVPGSTVRRNNVVLASTYINAAEIRAALTAEDLASGAVYQMTVVNPAPGGGTSSGLAFPISDFTLEPATADLSVMAGQSATTILTATPRFAPFDAAVSFSCTGLPQGCTASFSPATVTPGPAGATTTLTLATKARPGAALAAVMGPYGLVPPGLGLVLLAAAFALRILSRRTWPRLLARRRLVAAALVLLAIGLAGCGAGGDGFDQGTGTPAGTFTIGIKGTAGGLTVQTSVTLVVR